MGTRSSMLCAPGLEEHSFWFLAMDGLSGVPDTWLMLAHEPVTKLLLSAWPLSRCAAGLAALTCEASLLAGCCWQEPCRACVSQSA